MTGKELQELTRERCLELLEDNHFGRLAFVSKVGVMPSILPVNYVLDQNMVVFRSDPGSKLTAAILGAPVAFEIDGLDERHETGWSLVVHGHAEEVTDPTDLDRLRHTPLVPWAPGAKTHYARVRPGHIRGRQINVTDLPSNRWG